MFVPEVKNLFPASQLAPEEKERYAYNTAQMILGVTEGGKKTKGSDPLYTYDDEGVVMGGRYDPKAMRYANQLAKEMVNGDKSNGIEDYFPKGMSTQFTNALAKSGYVPGFEDKDTIAAIGKIIDARMKDDAGEKDFVGQFAVRSVQDDDGYRLELYTSDYRGRGPDGEKQYRSSKTVEIAFIPHDEISGRITRTSVANSPNEMLQSKAFLKAKALDGYLDALLMTSGF
jgi:hypothetical protein